MCVRDLTRCCQPVLTGFDCLQGVLKLAILNAFSGNNFTCVVFKDIDEMYRR
jgi:hypothetical protein